ncbi:MAG: hypothetical protein ACFE8B_00710 [Candidatus Hermodarchaeota archaeon]
MKEEENKNINTEHKRSVDQPNLSNNPRDYSSINKSNFIPSNNLDFLIRRLSNPRFLGSIHLKKEMNPNYRQLEDMLASEHELKLTRSIKNTIFNPLTKILIISAIIFNIFWFLSIYLL